jgi:uncharacterized RDD family membrane protein YckC
VAKLIVNPTAANRREILLSSSMILTIGRDPSNDLVLPDAMVSRRHAVVEHRDGHFFLRDCSSANGSVVNGDRVSERGLRDGDLVAIGSMRLLFREERADGAAKVVQHPSAVPLRCPGCGADYRRGDLFCRECGVQVAQPSGPPRAACPACAAAVPLPARFCNACGASLQIEGEREPPSRPDTEPLPVPAAPAPLAPQPRAAGSSAVAIAPLRAPAAAREAAPAARAERPAGDRRADVGRRTPRTPAAASAGSRLLAAVIDGVFVLSGQAMLLAPVGWYWWAREAPRTPSEVAYLPVLASATLVPLALLLGALYHVYFWTVKGATPGKELLELRVESLAGESPVTLQTAALRAFGYLLGFASLGAGFLTIAIGGSGLHDRVAGTRVVRVVRR